MSFIGNRQRKPVLAAAPVLRSVRPEAGCVQCGARLEMNDAGRLDPAGKCFNCKTDVSDGDDDEFDDLED